MLQKIFCFFYQAFLFHDIIITFNYYITLRLRIFLLICYFILFHLFYPTTTTLFILNLLIFLLPILVKLSLIQSIFPYLFYRFNISFVILNSILVLFQYSLIIQIHRLIPLTIFSTHPIAKAFSQGRYNFLILG